MDKDTIKYFILIFLLAHLLGGLLLCYYELRDGGHFEQKVDEPPIVQPIVIEKLLVLEYLGEYEITYYCSCSKCCGKSNGITASGAKVQPNHTIAAPSSFPFGTVLIIDGIEYTVEDRGGSIKGKRLDIYVPSHEEALQLGRHKAEVYEKKYEGIKQ